LFTASRAEKQIKRRLRDTGTLNGKPEGKEDEAVKASECMNWPEISRTRNKRKITAIDCSLLWA
jgi:hypothetical protein